MGMPPEDKGKDADELHGHSPAAAPAPTTTALPSSSSASSMASGSTIEPASEPPATYDDDVDFDGCYDAGSSASVSVTSSALRTETEHGRTYQYFKNGRYPIPNDSEEQAREDMKHTMLLELLDGKLFFAPIGEYPQKIIDVGTGTGIWAIEVGEQYPSASVRGIDLSPIQPVWVPPNVSFLVDDCELDWMSEGYDLVHFRFMIMVLKNVPKVFSYAYESLRPGGWIELQELSGVPFCDDGTMGDDDPVKVLYDLAGQAYAKFGFDTQLPAKLEPLLRAAGFENIHLKVKKVPIGVWARDPTLRLVGLYQKAAIYDFVSTLAGRPFKALGLSDEESQIRIALARRGLQDSKVHRYFNYYFWYAQKPLGGSGTEPRED